MGLQLPNLDDRTYADLVDEARRLIPTYDPKWTNHNPSDPGIALIEMFAYLTELLLYRLNQVTDANRIKFLKLLNGPAWTPTSDLASETRDAVLAVRARWRAVTPADYEQLALEDFNAWLLAMQRAQGDTLTAPDEWWATTGFDRKGNPKQLPKDILPALSCAVARAQCISGRNLDHGSEQARAWPAPSHVSLVVLPADPTGARKIDPLGYTGLQPAPLLAETLTGYFRERRMVTTRHHVVGPCYAPLSASIVVAHTSGPEQANLETRIEQALIDFMDPLSGGADGRGWPLGRDVYVSELCERLEAIAGVDYVADLTLSNCVSPETTRSVPATSLWNSEGELYGMQLAEYHLPLLVRRSGPPKISPVRFATAPSTRMVRAQLSVRLSAPSASTKQAAVRAIRSFFGPFDNTSPNQGQGNYLLADVRSQLPPTAAQPTLRVDSSHAIKSGNDIIGLHITPDELIDWSVVFEL
ncbi:MAG TPA: hypothetical protein VIV60_18265 [Polyangiaceae bacterium]